MSTKTTLDIGDVARMRASFFDEDGDPVDPDTVVLKVKKPDGTVVEPAVDAEGVGMYVGDASVDQHGTWYYRWEGAGTDQGAGESQFQVRKSEFD